MEDPGPEIIRIGPLTLRYLVDGSATSGALDAFEFTVPPFTEGSPPHFHQEVDEMVWGVEGRITFTVAGEPRVLGPREFTLIRKGEVHSFANRHEQTAVVLSLMTPGLIGPGYFRAMAQLFAASPAPDPEALRATMLRHGLIPAPTSERRVP